MPDGPPPSDHWKRTPPPWFFRMLSGFALLGCIYFIWIQPIGIKIMGLILAVIAFIATA